MTASAASTIRSLVDLTAIIDAPDERHRTHVDLFYPGTRLPDETLITRCVLLDVSCSPEKVDLAALPALHAVEKGCSVILKTGWERHRGTPAYDKSPSIDKALIERLVAQGAALILVDSPGVCGGATGPEHCAMDKYLADNKAHAVENLVNLDMITAATFALYCFPIYAMRTNAAPCRILADMGTRIQTLSGMPHTDACEPM
ncbi:hypothetical protein GX586_12395 [bacterium]|nr:hypothetical protein [bacterium]